VQHRRRHRRAAIQLAQQALHPDPEVQRADNIAFASRGSIWTVYVANSGQQPVEDVKVRMTGTRRKTFSFELGTVEPGRRWYNLPRESGLYSGGEAPQARLDFTAFGVSYRSELGRLERREGRSFVPIEFSEAAAREVADGVRVWAGRPDAEVRATDRLGTDEDWWVVYLATEAAWPVHEVSVRVLGSGARTRRLTITFPPIEPGRRRWWVLRPDSGFDADAPAPEVQADFDALGRRWRRTAQGLRAL
jgi:hypothetical protein